MRSLKNDQRFGVTVKHLPMRIGACHMGDEKIFVTPPLDKKRQMRGKRRARTIRHENTKRKGRDQSGNRVRVIFCEMLRDIHARSLRSVWMSNSAAQMQRQRHKEQQ